MCDAWFAIKNHLLNAVIKPLFGSFTCIKPKHLTNTAIKTGCFILAAPFELLSKIETLYVKALWKYKQFFKNMARFIEILRIVEKLQKP